MGSSRTWGTSHARAGSRSGSRRIAFRWHRSAAAGSAHAPWRSPSRPAKTTSSPASCRGAGSLRSPGSSGGSGAGSPGSASSRAAGQGSRSSTRRAGRSRSARADSTTLPLRAAAGNEGGMDRARLLELLGALARGETAAAEVRERLGDLPFEDLGFARLDHHRELRTGVAEVVFGAGKSPEELVAIVRRIADASGRVLVTRVDAAA